MDASLAWTQIVTAEDYEEHMAGIAGAGTGQMLDYLDPARCARSA